jgi:hypothetical protein
MREIELTQGLFALVDDEDFDNVNQHKWFVKNGKNTNYAATWIGPWRKRKILQMHHLIIGKPVSGMVTDHADRNGLNNQRYNIRNCTISQNSANRKPYGTSKYLGVSIVRRKSGNHWRAFTMINNKNKYLGIFKTQEEAALAYNKAALQYHGEFANLNTL